LDIFKATVDNKNFFIFFDKMIPFVGFHAYGAFCLFFNFIKERTFFFKEVADDLIRKQKFRFYLSLSVIKL